MTDIPVEIITFSPEEEELGSRLDKILVDRLQSLSRTQIQTLIKEGMVQVNDAASKPAYKLEPDDVVMVQLPPVAVTEILPEAIPLELVYEDADIAVIHKPAGMVVHPAAGHTQGTLVNALLARYPTIGEVGEDPERSGIVHRLDKDVSGLILVALNDMAREDLIEQFKARAVEKIYFALVDGQPPNSSGRIEAPIGRDPRNRKRMAVVRDGREALTEFQVVETYADHALLEIKIATGRTHQIRVHLAFIGCPVVGDQVYGFRKQRIKMQRLFLHAAKLGFDQPRTGARLSFEAPLPVGLRDILEKLPR